MVENEDLEDIHEKTAEFVAAEVAACKTFLTEPSELYETITGHTSEALAPLINNIMSRYILCRYELLPPVYWSSSSIARC